MNVAFLKGAVGICEKAVIARENQTYFWENLQFSLITEGFQSHYSFGKTFSFSSKTEGNTNFSVRQKTTRKLNRTPDLKASSHLLGI